MPGPEHTEPHDGDPERAGHEEAEHGTLLPEAAQVRPGVDRAQAEALAQDEVADARAKLEGIQTGAEAPAEGAEASVDKKWYDLSPAEIGDKAGAAAAAMLAERQQRAGAGKAEQVRDAELENKRNLDERLTAMNEAWMLTQRMLADKDLADETRRSLEEAASGPQALLTAMAVAAMAPWQEADRAAASGDKEREKKLRNYTFERTVDTWEIAQQGQDADRALQDAVRFAKRGRLARSGEDHGNRKPGWAARASGSRWSEAPADTPTAEADADPLVREQEESQMDEGEAWELAGRMLGDLRLARRTMEQMDTGESRDRLIATMATAAYKSLQSAERAERRGNTDKAAEHTAHARERMLQVRFGEYHGADMSAHARKGALGRWLDRKLETK